MSHLQIGAVLISAFLMFMQLGCSGNPAASNDNLGEIKISLRNVSAANSLAKINGLFTITSARVVIEKIKFESVQEDTFDFRFRQPFVQELALDSTAHVIETVQVPFGEYKESEIDIDDLKPEDGAAYTQNPDLRDRSIFVTGFLNDDSTQTFVFTSDLDAEQEREFNPPLVLDETSPSTNVVLTIDMNSWFVDGNGNLLDPRVGGNRSQIENNIKNSIDIFEDEDDDGRHDDHDDDDNDNHSDDD